MGGVGQVFSRVEECSAQQRSVCAGGENRPSRWYGITPLGISTVPTVLSPLSITPP